MSSLDESSAVHNNQLAFGILEKELGIPPVMSAGDLANSGQIDKLSMVLYLTQIQKAFSAPAKTTSLGMLHIRKKENPLAVNLALFCFVFLNSDTLLTKALSDSAVSLT